MNAKRTSFENDFSESKATIDTEWIAIDACTHNASSISWTDSHNGIHIRVYNARNGRVTERCWDGNGWYTGSFNQVGIQTSAVVWQNCNGLHIRVYLSSGSNIQEWCWDSNGWFLGSFSFPGISTTATIWTRPHLGIRVYIFNENNSMIERCFDGNGWYTGAYS